MRLKAGGSCRGVSSHLTGRRWQARVRRVGEEVWTGVHGEELFGRERFFDEYGWKYAELAFS